MRALFDSIVRTFTPIIVGQVIGWFVASGITLDPEFETALTVVLGAAFAGIYYIGARLLETYVTPKFGWLLGLAKAPVYSKSDTSATELAYRDLHDDFLVRISEQPEQDLLADIQGARSRAGLPPI